MWKEKWMNQNKNVSSSSHLKRLQKTPSSEESNCRQIFVFAKMWNAWERQKSLFLFLSFYILIDQNAVIFMVLVGKRQASKSVITQKRGLGAILPLIIKVALGKTSHLSALLNGSDSTIFLASKNFFKIRRVHWMWQPYWILGIDS